MLLLVWKKPVLCFCPFAPLFALERGADLHPVLIFAHPFLLMYSAISFGTRLSSGREDVNLLSLGKT